MIRVGQAGIPLSCKGRTNKDGLVYTKKILDLNAMEVQFVRGLYVMEDEEAQFMKDYAKENDVELHVHAPYYINLGGSGEELDLSFEKILAKCPFTVRGVSPKLAAILLLLMPRAASLMIASSRIDNFSPAGKDTSFLG